jgi:hypothetical protein
MVGLGIPAAEAAAEAERRVGRMEARLDWLKAQFERMRALHDAMGDYWARMFDAHPELDVDDPAWDDFPEPPEALECHRIEDALMDVRLHDRWPRHLHFGVI